MSEEYDAVVAGHICLDIIPTLTKRGFQYEPGRLLEVGAPTMATGGPVSNTGLALSKLGIRTRLMGKVGVDDFGQTVQRIISRYSPGLVRGMIIAPDEATSYSIILSPPDMDRMFLHCPGCNDTFGADDIDYAMLEDSRLLHFGYPPLLKRVIENDGAELIEIFRRAKSTGVTTSLDMSMPDPASFSGRVDWRSILKATLPFVDIYLPSIEETLYTLYPEDFRKLAGEPEKLGAGITPARLNSIAGDLMNMGPSIVGLKLGPMGLYLRTSPEGSWVAFGRARPEDLAGWANRELWSPCFQAKVVGTTGAGDATIAGFLAAFLRGCPPEECGRMACAVGGCNVEAADALGGLLSWEETMTRLVSGWPRRPLAVTLTGWREHDQTGVWKGPSDRG